MADDSDIAYITAVIAKSAAQVRTNAGLSGSWDDGGASAMSERLRYFTLGWNRVLPESYQNILDERDKKMDPEYAKFLELKKKFGE